MLKFCLTAVILTHLKIYAYSDVIGKIQFLRFENKQNTDENGYRCDSVLIFCDTVFNISISNSPTAGCTRFNCAFKFDGNNPVENVQGIVDFLKDQTDVPNPIVVKWKYWTGGFRINVKAIDKDYITRLEVIDIHNIIIRGTPSPQESTTLYTTQTSLGLRAKDKTTLRLRYKIFCAKDYYGSKCETYCDPWNVPGHDKCNTNGTIVCRDGWYGRQCNIKCIVQNIKDSHFMCNENGQKVCKPGWIGNNCDISVITPSESFTIATDVLLFFATVSPVSSIANNILSSSILQGINMTTLMYVLHSSNVIESNYNMIHSSRFISKVTTTNGMKSSRSDNGTPIPSSAAVSIGKKEMHTTNISMFVSSTLTSIVPTKSRLHLSTVPSQTSNYKSNPPSSTVPYHMDMSSTAIVTSSLESIASHVVVSRKLSTDVTRDIKYSFTQSIQISVSSYGLVHNYTFVNSRNDGKFEIFSWLSGTTEGVATLSSTLFIIALCISLILICRLRNRTNTQKRGLGLPSKSDNTITFRKMSELEAEMSKEEFPMSNIYCDQNIQNNGKTAENPLYDEIQFSSQPLVESNEKNHDLSSFPPPPPEFLKQSNDHADHSALPCQLQTSQNSDISRHVYDNPIVLTSA